MLDFSFHIEGANAATRAVTPTLEFKLRIAAIGEEQHIHSMLLRCQLQIEAARRHYERSEQSRLFELFGETTDWGRTLQNMPWTDVALTVPTFDRLTTVELPVPCTYDFNVAATKLFDALEGGTVPLCFSFSGTVFYTAEKSPLQVGHIRWGNEAKYQLPVSIWREMMDRYYPESVWIAVPKETFKRVNEFKRHTATSTWERALEKLLDQAEELTVP